MNEELDKIMFGYMPDNIKLAAATYNTHKLVEQATGMTDLTFAKVAAYLSTKIAERQARWQSIGDGLLALHELQKEGANAPSPATDNMPKGVVTPGTPKKLAPQDAKTTFSPSFPGYEPPKIKF
jgi:hypothetical protein